MGLDELRNLAKIGQLKTEADFRKSTSRVRLLLAAPVCSIQTRC